MRPRSKRTSSLMIVQMVHRVVYTALALVSLPPMLLALGRMVALRLHNVHGGGRGHVHSVTPPSAHGMSTVVA